MQSVYKLFGELWCVERVLPNVEPDFNSRYQFNVRDHFVI